MVPSRANRGIHNIVEPVLNGHPWGFLGWPLNTVWPLNTDIFKNDKTLLNVIIDHLKCRISLQILLTFIVAEKKKIKKYLK